MRGARLGARRWAWIGARIAAVVAAMETALEFGPKAFMRVAARSTIAGTRRGSGRRFFRRGGGGRVRARQPGRRYEQKRSIHELSSVGDKLWQETAVGVADDPPRLARRPKPYRNSRAYPNGEGALLFRGGLDSPITVSTHRQPESPFLSGFTRKPRIVLFFRTGRTLRLLRNRCEFADQESQGRHVLESRL